MNTSLDIDIGRYEHDWALRYGVSPEHFFVQWEIICQKSLSYWINNLYRLLAPSQSYSKEKSPIDDILWQLFMLMHSLYFFQGNKTLAYAYNTKLSLFASTLSRMTTKERGQFLLKLQTISDRFDSWEIDENQIIDEIITLLPRTTEDIFTVFSVDEKGFSHLLKELSLKFSHIGEQRYHNSIMDVVGNILWDIDYVLEKWDYPLARDMYTTLYHIFGLFARYPQYVWAAFETIEALKHGSWSTPRYILKQWESWLDLLQFKIDATLFPSWSHE